MTPSAAVTSDTTIRAANAKDLSRIAELLVASALPTVGVAEAIGEFFVAERDNDIVGVIGIEVCSTNAGLLRSAVIAEPWRGRGLGKRLVERAIAHAKARGIATLYLLTTSAESYFPRFGFRLSSRDSVPKEVRATAEFQGACPASAIVMSLSIGDGAQRLPMGTEGPI